MRLVSAAALVMILAGGASAQGTADKTRVAPMAVLAQLAPKGCSHDTTDDEAVAADMATVQISERERPNDDGRASSRAAEAFAASVQRDVGAACDPIGQQLGDDGLGLSSVEN